MRCRIFHSFCHAACLIVLGGLLSSCGNADKALFSENHSGFRAQLARTTHGVVHVRAADFRGLGFGLAYAYAQDNVCMFADSLLTVRGERSRFFGPDARATRARDGEYGAASDFMDLNNQDSDFFFKGYLDLDKLRASYAAGGSDALDMLTGYAAGYNRYIKDNAARLPAACKDAPWVRTISVDDMFLVLAEKALHASGQVFAKEIVASAHPVQASSLTPQELQRRLAKLEQLGSNALAVGKDLSANGRGLLLGNPHYPWTSTDRFYQAHLTVPGRYDAMGVILGGIPAIVIGFNKDVAWTHTVTTAVHFTTFQLQRDPQDPAGYLHDGGSEKMAQKTVRINVLEADGRLSQRSKTFFFTRQGAVIGWQPGVVHVLGDPNRFNTRLMEQWLSLGRARSVGELKASLDRYIGVPWVNTIAADRYGNTLYADASVVPSVPAAHFASDCLLEPAMLMFDGSRASCSWAEESIFGPRDAPSLLRTDYVGNSNDSYWLTNPRSLLTGFSVLYGPVGVPQKLRTRSGFMQFEELLARRSALELIDIQDLVFANRIYAAELVLPEFLQYCESAGHAELLKACSVLAAWDRKANLDSRGAVLFREFWLLAAAIPDKWALPFDAADPVHTPRRVAPAAMPQMIVALKTAVFKMEGLNIPLDAALGDYQSETRGGVRFALHGGIGDQDGAYNSIHMLGALGPDGYRQVEWGTSYVQTVGFDDAGPVAYAMLLYGQSVDPASPWYADQLGLYSRKTWPVLPFSEAAMKADPRYSETTVFE